MNKVKLGEVADISAGQSAPQGESFSLTGIPFVRAGSLEYLLNGISENELELVSDDVARKHRLKLQPTGTIVFAKSGMSCKKGYVYVLKQPCYVVSHLACVFPRNSESKFLYYYFQWHKPNFLVKSESYPSISIKDLSGLEILYPSVEKQVEIVSVLDAVSALINLSNAQIELFNRIIKSRFVEMFGTLPANEKAWPVVTIRDIVKEVRYGTSRPAVENGQYPYLRMNNITYNGDLDLSDLKQIDIPKEELEKCTVCKGDVLFNRTNSKELVGKTCVYDREELMVLAGFVIRIRVNERVLPEFLSAFMNTFFMKATLLGMSKAAIGQANINAQELQDIMIYTPPTELQKQFVRIKHQTDKSKFVIQQSLAELETLKKALMQQYFG